MTVSKRQIKERSERKEKILIGALEVFKKHGIEKSTMEQIAIQSEFGTATIYYYFSSKEEIFSAILLDGWEKLWKNNSSLENHRKLQKNDFSHANVLF